MNIERNDDEWEALRREIAALKAERERMWNRESELRENLTRCGDILSSLRDWYWEVDERFIITYCSDRVLDITGYAPEEMIGRSPLEFAIPEDRLRIERTAREALRSRKPFADVECAALARDGGRIYFLLSGVPFYNAEEKFQGYRGISRDTTGRKQMEALMGEVRDMALALGSVRDLKEGLSLCLRTALPLSGMDEGGVYIRNQSDGSLRLVVQEGLRADFIEKISCYPADSPNTRLVMNGKPIYTHTKDLDASIAETSMPEGLRLVAVIPILHQESVIGCFNFGSHTLDEFPALLPGLVEALVAPIGNAIARLQSEQTIRDSEATLRSVFQATPVGILFLKDRMILSANDSLCEMMGYTQEEVVGESTRQVYFTEREYLDVGRAMYGRGLQKGLGSVETRMRRKDGAPIHAILTGRMLHADNPSHGFVVTVQDITERKRAEDDREHTLSILQATLESTDEGILVVSITGALSIYNRKFLMMWELTEGEIAFMKDMSLLDYITDRIKTPDKLREQVMEYYKRPDINGTDILEMRDGRVIEWYSRPQRLGDAVVGRIWSFRDVTERRRLEHQFLQAQKMEMVGRLAGGVAHDFNNILTVINGTADMTLMFMQPSDPHYHVFEEIRKAGERAANLTRQLLAFSRKQIIEPRVINLNRILLDMDKMFRRLIGENIELITILDETLLPVKVDPGQIEQVLTNLVVNARDAMPEGGKLGIETRNTVIGAEDAKLHPDLSEGKYVLFTVADTGIGIDAKTLPLVFDPFFTTKPRGRGTGLGLSTCYGIVKQSGGDIGMESAPGRGTVVRVYLPAREGENVDPFTSPAAREMTSGTETVLVVEDEPTVSEVVAVLLGAAGYRVHTASNGVDALSVIERIPETIHLLVTDVVMPLMGGRELADRLSVSRPGLKVLFMSGYTDNSIVRDTVLDPGVRFIQKPFSSAAFLRKVRVTLDE